MSNKGFTLIELIVVIMIISSLLGFTITGISRVRSSLIYKNSIDQVVADIRYSQQMTDASRETCRIQFTQGTNEYSIFRGNTLVKSGKITQGLQFYGKSYFSFAPDGFTDVGGSGTLVIKSSTVSKKVIVSSRGRIRVE